MQKNKADMFFLSEDAPRELKHTKANTTKYPTLRV